MTWGVTLLDGYRARMCPSAAGAEIGRWVAQAELGRGSRGEARAVRRRLGSRVQPPDHVAGGAAARLAGSRLLIREDQTLLHGRPWTATGAQAESRCARSSARRPDSTRGRRAGGTSLTTECRHSRLFPARHCVDNRAFRSRAAALVRKRSPVRAAFGISDDAPVVLFCGKLIDKKQPLLLLDAFRACAGSGRAGSSWPGTDRFAGRSTRRRGEIPGVRMAGFLNQSELPSAYAAADMFVLPSARHETWGLVVNEAMNFALPMVVSDRVGCGADLVRSDWNGTWSPATTSRHWRPRSTAWWPTRTDGEPSAPASLALVDAYSVEACADGIVAACRAVIGRRAGHARSAAVMQTCAWGSCRRFAPMRAPAWRCTALTLTTRSGTFPAFGPSCWRRRSRQGGASGGCETAGFATSAIPPGRADSGRPLPRSRPRQRADAVAAAEPADRRARATISTP